MNAAVVHDFQAPPRYTTFADPVAAEGEVLVRVSAVGLHPVVKSLANGSHYGSTGTLPFVPGVDGVGRLDDGSRVYFGFSRPPFGTFAELTATARFMCLPAPDAIPDALDDATLAAIANPGMSSWAALKARARFASGERLLILGATGVAGKLAVQIAKRLGARRVVAAGRNPQALELLKDLGADAIVSLDQPREALVSAFNRELSENGVDVVLDYLWGQPAECLLEAISQKGLQKISPRIRFVQVGGSAGPTISLPAATLRSSGLELLGSGFGSASIEQILQSVAEFLKEAAREQFQMEIQSAPLSAVEELWHSSAQKPGTRIVFRP